ncbi:MAG: succinyldiaminopimelate transaminase [Actinobacteria bacterium]|nr:succinyldiaminopimelate transaminase [Actinomycetota bacterium]
MFQGLPEYPWQKLKPYEQIAKSHPDGIVDLSVGSPVDPTPKIIQDALNASTNAPGYPSTAGSLELREAIVDWFAMRRGVPGLSSEQVMPSIGSKELISLLPLMLGLGPADVVIQPKVAYTAYVVGAALCGAQIVSEDDPDLWPANTKLIWLNSPGNPDGKILTVEQMRKAVFRARQLDAVLASDECYAEFGWGNWEKELVPSALDTRVNDGNLENILALYSLSKQSNLAGYRAAFAAGDTKLVKKLLNIRTHSGLIMPAPVQKAVIAAVRDDQHVSFEKDIYRKRRELLVAAVKKYGFEISDSEGGLYIWATLGEDCWNTVQKMAELGILVVPGEFYETAGSKFVRFSITASDEKILEGASRLGNALGLSS